MRRLCQWSYHIIYCNNMIHLLTKCKASSCSSHVTVYIDLCAFAILTLIFTICYFFKTIHRSMHRKMVTIPNLMHICKCMCVCVCVCVHMTYNGSIPVHFASWHQERMLLDPLFEDRSGGWTLRRRYWCTLHMETRHLQLQCVALGTYRSVKTRSHC